jgi:hypothetical protein
MPPGSFGICPICRWEDDLVQLRWPQYVGGANSVSLAEAQRSYKELGISRERFNDSGRMPMDGEPVEPGFRLVDLTNDDFEDPGNQDAPWPDDRTVLYWWRPTFWRRAEE